MTRYFAPGTFAWIDLRTKDPADAKRFYAALFGWTYTDWDATYSVAALDGDAVAGLKPQAEAPSFWLNYLAVENADAVAAKTRELGGTVHAEPFDNEAGRMAVIADPTGARLALWQSREGLGACRVNDPGCLAWNELSTDDAPAAIGFYSALFGGRIERAGVRELRPDQEGTLPHWMPYFAVASVAEALARASSAGGEALAGPLDIPAGHIAILRDPQGAVLGILEGDFRES
jgi:predicted enzyme related to lactoylglutathione lyase